MVILSVTLVWKGIQALGKEEVYRVEPKKFEVFFPRYAPCVPKTPPHPMIKSFTIKDGSIFVREEKPCFVIHINDRYYTCSLSGKLLGLASRSDLLQLPFLYDVDVVDLELSNIDKKVLYDIKDIVHSPILTGISLRKR